MYFLQDIGLSPSDGHPLEITSDHFGARYTAFRGFDRFQAQTDALDYGLLVWPGGRFSEVQTNRFGYEYPGLFNSDGTGGKPGLTELFSYAVENGLSVSIVLPTARYQNDQDMLEADARDFFNDLYGNAFGPLPDKIIFEIGNEHYGVFDGDTEVARAQAYGQIVNTYADVIVETEPPGIPADQIQFSVQLARSTAANDALLDSLDDTSILIADLVSHHRFPGSLEAGDDRLAIVQDALDDWAEATGAAEGPNLYLSEYTTASLTRVNAASDFIASGANTDGLTLEDIDLATRTTDAFEQYYQDTLGARPYGLEQGEMLLQLFTDYAELQLEAAAPYGWDSIHAGRMSIQGTDGQPYTFAGAQAYDMMAESLAGTTVLNWHDEVDCGDLSVFGFDSADKLVIFLTAPEFDGENDEFFLDISQLGDLEGLWAERLTAEVPDNWNTLFDIPQTDIDQSNEAETFAVGHRQTFDPRVDGTTIGLRFTQPNEIVRLSFARTDMGRDDIQSWHAEGESYQDLGDSTGDFPFLLPPTDEEFKEEHDCDDEISDLADAAGGGAGGGLALALLLLLFL
ncbi:MAG: hypothetical protein AAGA12_08900 [Pseudomonadota bacterium]